MSTTSSEEAIVEQVRRFWDSEPCGSRLVESEQDRAHERAYFESVTRTRYALEPHIPRTVKFPRWRDHDVLEVGCGLGTDGEQFVRTGARYQAIDLSGESVAAAQRRFELQGLRGSFSRADVTRLPFADSSFDLVYSHGVLHHVPEIDRALDEIYRVLRPGGSALVVLYNRSSLNYQLNIRILRRAGALLLLLPGGESFAARLTGEQPSLIAEHKRLLREHGLHYVRDLDLFLSHNTDGPRNPYSRVYGADDLPHWFGRFSRYETRVRFLNLRSYPEPLRRLLPAEVERRLGTRFGWHRYVWAVK